MNVCNAVQNPGNQTWFIWQNLHDIYAAMIMIPVLKGAQSDCLRFFSNLRRFWYQKKAHIFLITPGEFYSWKMYCVEDINENVTSYGNHN